MRKCLYLMMVVGILIMLVLPVLPAGADKAVDEYAKMIGKKVVTSSNTDVTYTGKHWKEDGDDKYKYIARIHQAPIYNEDGSLVDCSWHGSEDAWVIVDNVFSAQVIGSYITVTYQGKSMSWNPVVMIDSKEYVAKGSPKVTNDPLNENYRNNVLEWDYGVCVRRVRVIEGLIQETWTFDKDPHGNVWIRDYAQRQKGFTWAIAPYAFDADGNDLPINQYKQVSAKVMAEAKYPVTIDPTSTFTTSASDGWMRYEFSTTYSTSWNSATGTVRDTQTYLQIGQQRVPSTLYMIMQRSCVYFDTSALPDGSSITAANLSLYGEIDNSLVDFNIVIQNGMSTYPHDPMATEDYDKSNYSGDGGTFATSGFSITGYNNLSLNATGLSWINLTGTTKFMLRSDRDIAGTSPTGHEYVQVYAYEKGAGYRPYLEVTYVSSGPPDVSSVAATYVSKSTARVNGYLDSDGGEATTVWFNYWEWYNQNWSDCIEFSINASMVDSDLTNFPVLITGAQVNQSNPNFWTTVDVNGLDILFTDADGTKLHRELVSIDTTNKTMECYVNVPSVSSAIDTPIYMYYGNPAGAETNDVETWNSDYLAVYHMGDLNTSAISDSTGVYTGTKKGANEPVEATGQFNGDLGQNGDGTDDYIDIGNPIANDSSEGTVDIVCKADTIDDASTNRWMFGRRHSIAFSSNSNTGSFGFGVGYEGDALSSYGTRKAAKSGFTSTDWNCASGTYKVNETVKLYVNGAYQSQSADVMPADIRDMAAGLRIIGPMYTSFFYDGTISEVRVSNISRSAAWVKSTYYSLMEPENFCPVTDVFHETATQSKNTGDSFYSSLTGLTANTVYGFRAMGTQTQGTDYGAWLFFDTSVTLGSPSNALCNPTSSSIGLTWNKGSNTSTTFVRWKTGGYPSSTVDGNLLCNTSDIGYVHSGLTPGTTYYYRLWGLDGGEYSTTSTTLICTTLAGSGAAATPNAPTEPDTWTDTTDASALEDLPIYEIGNTFFDSFSLPHSTGWMAAAFGFVMASGFIIYSRSKNLLVAILTVMIFSIILSIIGMLPMWAVYCFAFTSLGMSWKELR